LKIEGIGKDKDVYVAWSVDETNELFHLPVDAINRDLCDDNG